jgi:hypothetical protein
MKYVPFAFMFLGIMNLTCSSPLSDVSISDPSVIQPQLYVSKTIDNGAKVVEYIGEIWDKNLQLVTLKDGGVKVNNISMGTHTIPIFNGQEYYISGEDSLKYSLNTNYTFVITLGDGSQYNGSVTTQSKDLYQFTAPSSQSRTQDLLISWLDTDPNATMSVQVLYKYQTDSSSSSNTETVQIPSSAKGSFIISKTYFTPSQGKTTEVDLTLISEIRGTIDSRFRAGSSIVSDLKMTRNVTMTN